jgi:hypothetical protein
MNKRKIKVLSHSDNSILGEFVTDWIKNNNVEVIKIHFTATSLGVLPNYKIIHYAYIEYYEIEE